MSKYNRFRIKTNDYVGMALEVMKVLYRESVDLKAVEVFSKMIYIKTNELSPENTQALKVKLMSLAGVHSVVKVGLMSYEADERKLLGVLDSVEDGIVMVNDDDEIEFINRPCEAIFENWLPQTDRWTLENLFGVENIPSGLENNHYTFEARIGDTTKEYVVTSSLVMDDESCTIGRVLAIRDADRAIELANTISDSRDEAFDQIVGDSSQIQQVKRLIQLVAKGSSTVILRGESGTGKELFAKALQRLSNRRDKPFISLNCAALPDALIESELFGYKKGSFTGALDSGKEGLFKQAHGGTLFLDEVGELSLPMQAKILRVLQEGKVRPIGGRHEELVDVRIIAATNRNLEEMIRTKQFREDLYYRLNVVPIEIPPLNTRKEDILPLVHFFIERLNSKLNKKIRKIDSGFIAHLMGHQWTGNVRELENIVERGMNLCEGDCLMAHHFMSGYHTGIGGLLTGEYLNMTLKERVEQCETVAINEALDRMPSIRQAAKVLGVSHSTLLAKMKKLGIHRNKKT